MLKVVLRALLSTALLGTALLLPSIARSQDRPAISAGYLLGFTLEDGDDSDPLPGVYLSLASSGSVPIEAFMSYQRSEIKVDGPFNIKFNFDHEVVQLGLGARHETKRGRERPFLRGLLGVRRDSIDSSSHNSVTGTAGCGVDVLLGRGISLRLGADVQMAFRSGENLEATQVSFGFTR